MLFTTQTSTANLLKSLLVVFALAISGLACDGAVGPAGPPGADGTDGVNGTDGTNGSDGENGTDGTNGTNGQDGEDGTDGEDGEDGNANVTLYLFDGHDFAATFFWNGELGDIGNPDDYGWMVYLREDFVAPGPGSEYYFVPGFVLNDDYEVRYSTFTDAGASEDVSIFTNGTGSAFDGIHVIRIEASNVEDCTGGGCLRASPESLIPADLDVSDYDAVMAYYGLSEADAIRL